MMKVVIIYIYIGVYIDIGRTVYRSEVMVVKVDTAIAKKWITFMITGLGEMDLQTIDEEEFEFAPAYSIWVPDSTAEFERVIKNLKINVNSFKYIKTVKEKH
jgi:hypothetical protein